MSIEQEAAELLEKTADGFESGRYGWVKRVARDGSGELDRFCSIGALYYEAGLYDCNGIESPEERGAKRKLYMKSEQALAAAVEVPWTSSSEISSTSGIPHWNDGVAKSVDEVIEAMKEAAKSLRNQA